MSMISTRYQAFEALINPEDYTNEGKTSLLADGYNYWSEDDDDGEEEFIAALSNYGEYALADMLDSPDLPDLPLFHEPAAPVVLGVLTAISIREMDVFADTPPHNIRPANAVIDYTARNVTQAALETQDTDVLQDIAERLFQTVMDKSLHPGRVCTGFIHSPPDHVDAPEDVYCEFPMPAASKLHYRNVEVDGSLTDPDQIAEAFMDNNYLYVPFQRFEELLAEQFKESVEIYLDHERENLDANERAWVFQHTEPVRNQIKRWHEAHRLELLYESYDEEREKIDILIKAIADAPDKVATLATPLKAREIAEAVERYEPEKYEESLLSDLRSPHNIQSLLYAEADRSQVKVYPQDDEADMYELRQGSSWGSKQLSVSSIEDLLELPCYEAMFEYMEKHGPVHDELLNFVGTAKWLDIYYNDKEKFVSDVHDMFSNYSWYDEATTDFQVNDERERRDRKGNPYNPKKCRHDDMQRWCIGLSVCPYSIYGSLPFAKELYDGLPDNDSQS